MTTDAMANDECHAQPGCAVCPVSLRLAGRLGVVVGGGEVGRRRARAVLAGGGQVRLVCLEPKPTGAAWDRVEWQTGPYHESQLEGAWIVFAAAMGEVNRQVVRDARARGLLVNVADDPAASDFLMPATMRRGPLTLAVTTAGAVPAAAREVRLWLEDQVDERFVAWVESLAELRPWIRQQVTDAGRRRQVWYRLAQRSWLERFRQDGPAEARRQLQAEALRLVSAEARPL